MNKGTVIKAGIILGFFLVVIGVSLAFTLVDKDPDVANITNGSDVYLSTDDIEVTYQELWDTMKKVDGLEYLLNYVDEMLLAEYIEEVTDEQVAEYVNLLTYSTTDEEIIAEIQADAELNEQYLLGFDNSLILLGYDPEDPAEVRASLELIIAKDLYAKEYISNSADDEKYAVTSDDVRDYFTLNTKGDVCAIDIHFSSENEAKKVLDYFELVPNFNLGIGEYVGLTPIDEVASDEFDETNTRTLTDDEVFEKFLFLYNFMNPWAEQLDTEIPLEDFCANYADLAIYNYDDMTEGRQSADTNVLYANYLFDTLSTTNETKLRYSYDVQAFGDGIVLTFKINEEEPRDFDDLSAFELIDLRNELIDAKLTDIALDEIMTILRSENDFEIVDPEMALVFEYENQISFDDIGSKTVVARVNGEDITADDLFGYMEEKVGTFYSLEVAKIERLIDSDEFEEVYGTERDFMSNNSDKMKEHREALREMKTNFSNNVFASYGFSSATYTWNEFLYLAFSADDENEVLQNIYVIGNLQPMFIAPIIDFTLAEDIVQEEYDEYFSLNADHLLIFIDRDRDFTPDGFNDFIDGLEGDALTEYNALKVAFEDLIFDKYENGGEDGEGMSFQEIVEEYQDNLINDVDNEWAEFKQYGFWITTEDLTAQESISHENSDNLDDAFAASLKRIYDLYVRDENKDEADYLDTQLTVSDFGIHLILASKGSAFDKPTAMFPIEDDDDPADYTDGVVNTNDLPTPTQIDLYHQLKYAEVMEQNTDVFIPTNVYDAVDAYYGEIWAAFFSQTGYSIATTEYIKASNPVFDTNSAERIEYLDELLRVFYITNFPIGFDNPYEVTE